MIRSAKKEEINYLNKLTDYKISLNEFNEVLVCVEDNIIKAFLDYSVMYERMEINYIFVLEEYRKKGIGYQLIDYIINNHNFDNITLEVNEFNTKAINLYNKLGFKIISKRENYYNNASAYLMERRK